MAASPPLETDPRTLRAKLRALEAARATGLDDVRLEALAEACFRIALHPGTAPVEAIQLLQRAAACDPANPKPAYHLARLYFVHDELGMAGQWLQRAFLLCPTSHRIWVHVSLLQRKFPATIPSIFAFMYLQAHHLDLSFYDHYFKPGAYLSTTCRTYEKLALSA